MLITASILCAFSTGAFAQDVPTEQAVFLKEIAAARQAYKDAKNDLVKGVARQERGKAICAAVPDKEVQNWVGSIHKLSSNGDGFGVVSVELEDGVILKTWNNSLSDMFDDTLIDPADELFARIISLEEGQVVIFSGAFIEDSSGVDCFREASMTLRGSMSDPEYIFKFSSITLR
jgi:hypothetical protein